MNWGNQYRRNDAARRAILDSALELCRDMGYVATSVEGIARRAGVGKQTIYRWWPSKGVLLLDALNEAGGASATFPDTGDLVADLTGQMRGVVRFLEHPTFGAVFRALVAGAQSDGTLAERFMSEIIEPRRTGARRRLELACERGELAPGVDARHMMELLYAPLYYRLLVTREPIEIPYVETHVSTTLGMASVRPVEVAPAAPDSDR